MFGAALVSAMAVVVGIAGDDIDSASEASLVTTLSVSGCPDISTSGNLLVAILHAENQLQYWAWDDLKASPKTTPVLWPHNTVQLGNGMIAENVLLGLSHGWLKNIERREKEYELKRDKKSEGGQPHISEEDQARIRKVNDEEKARTKKDIEREDRVVAQMKYLQEVMKAGGRALVIRGVSGDEFSVVDCGGDKAWYTSKLMCSKDGKTLGVLQSEESSITQRYDAASVRVGIVDPTAHSIRWIAATRSDDTNGRSHAVTEIKAAISNGGKRIALVASNGKGGWICLMDADKRGILWEHCGVAGTLVFESADFSPDAKKIYVGDRAGWIFCFDADTGGQLPIGETSIRGSHAAASPDGRLLAVTSGGRVLIYDVQSGNVLWRASPPGLMYGVAFAPDSKRLALACKGSISIFDLAQGPDGNGRTRRSLPHTVPKAPVVAAIKLPTLAGPGYPYLEMSGRFLVAKLCAERELRYWNWSNLKDQSKTTHSLAVERACVMADGMIAESVCLGLPHQALQDCIAESKQPKKPKLSNAPKWGESQATEDHAKDRSEEDRIADEKLRYQQAAGEEDAAVAKMKYLQEVKRSGGCAIVIRNAAGTEYTRIDCENDRKTTGVGANLQPMPQNLIQSSNGQALAVLQYATSPEPDSANVRGGIVDRTTRSVRWIGSAQIVGKSGDLAFHCDTALSGDGKRLVLFGGIARKGGWICVMDADKGSVLWETRGVAKTNGLARGAISPDGKRIYAADEMGGVFCFDGDTGKQLARWDISGAIVLSPDGRLLAVMAGDPTPLVSIYSAQSGKLLQYVTPYDPHMDVAFSPDSKYLAIGGNNGISIHDLTVTSRPKGGNGAQTAAEKRPETARSASAPESPTTLSGHIGWIHCVAYSPDGKTLASGSTDNTIRLWDATAGSNRAILKGHTGAVRLVAFSRDGKTLASASEDKTIRLWDAVSGKNTATFNGHTAAVSSVAFSPDGKAIASGSEDKTIKLWDLATGKNTATRSGHAHEVMSVAFSPDGKSLASGGKGYVDAEIRLWDLATGKSTTILEEHDRGYAGIMCVAFSPDGKTLATAGFDSNVKLWDLATGKNTATLGGGIFEFAFSVAFSPDGRTLASGRAHDRVELWDVATGRNIATLNGHTNTVHSVAFSPDGKTLASGSFDRTIRIWNVKTITERQR